jgi:hypothetical protein
LACEAKNGENMPCATAIFASNFEFEVALSETFLKTHSKKFVFLGQLLEELRAC